MYINGMVVHTSGSRAHVIHIMKVLATTFNNVIWKIGGQVDRTTRGGGASAHSEGRAADIYLDAFDPVDKRLGDLLFRLFHTHAGALKVDHVIWNHLWWDNGMSAPGPYPYEPSNGPHTNHVHVAFKDDHLDDVPHNFDVLCVFVVADFVRDGDAHDRHVGLYGKAFFPRNAETRRTAGQRKKSLLVNMGMKDADRYP